MTNDPGRRGKEGPEGRIKKEPNAQVLCRNNLDFCPDDRQTPARREARNHRSEDAKMLGPLPRGPQCTGRASLAKILSPRIGTPTSLVYGGGHGKGRKKAPGPQNNTPGQGTFFS